MHCFVLLEVQTYIFRRNIKKHHLRSEILPVLLSRSKQGCGSAGSMWQIKCHIRTSSMVCLSDLQTKVPLWTRQLFPTASQWRAWHSHPRGWRAPGHTAGSSAAAAALPSSSQSPPRGLKYLLREKTRGNIATNETCIDTYRKQDWAAFQSEVYA